MALKVEHELHHRRLGRNVGLGLVLVAFVVLIFALTLAKTKRGDFQVAPEPAAATQTQEGGN
ncbi:hypothetical protein LZG00_06855 [Rhodobacteraceae bacterium LMO-12]|nr:hypothetical protein [Rhodobacteraceae bacterium LMO-JJ12]